MPGEGELDPDQRLRVHHRRAGALELSVPQYGALSVFDVAADLSSAELARISQVTPQSMNEIVHQLVDTGLLQRSRHPTRGKVLVLSLSPEGRNRLDKSTRAVRDVEHALLDGLSRRDEQAIRTWLTSVPTRLR